MKETIERLRAARVRLLNIDVGVGHRADLQRVARDIQTSIAELEKVQALTQALAPAFESIQGAVRKAYEVRVNARCTCGKVNVTSALKGYTTSSPGRTDPQCPIHGGTADV